jgi:hypothetical protein
MQQMEFRMAFFKWKFRKPPETTEGIVHYLAQYELLTFFCWVVCVFWHFTGLADEDSTRPNFVHSYVACPCDHFAHKFYQVPRFNCKLSCNLGYFKGIRNILHS